MKFFTSTSRPLGEAYVSSKIDVLLSQADKAHGPLTPPIDPSKLAQLCSVLSIERRPMIPEGVLTPVQGGFRIYLQSNFARQSTMSRRERFTLAHEIAHTLFYQVDAGLPKPIRPSPKKDRLERLCHLGASQILMPEVLLRRELKGKGEIASAESIFHLAKLFEVSVEVLMRRLHALGLIADEKFAAVLVDINNDRQAIQAACHGPILSCNVAKPERGMDFDAWVRPLLSPAYKEGDLGWVHVTNTSKITARKVLRSKRSFILELKFGPRT